MRAIDVGELLKRLNQLYEEQGLTTVFTGDDWTDGASSLFGDIVEIINEQSTIEPVNRGRWVEDICCNDIVMCNACGNEAYFDLDVGTYILFDYCPHCGAKMGGDD